ncbi:MAG: sigma-70 family RNA polymerase sigma factor [Actinomycetota bacterium]
MEDRSTSFLEFARVAEPRLRYALVAAHGAERGLEAANDALVYGWRHWDRVRGMANPIGFLYRVGQRKARRQRHSPRANPVIPEDRPPWIEPHLSEALASLTPRQREVVVLVEGFEWTHREAAEVLGISASSVQTHLERGLAQLRRSLGVTWNE